MNNKFFLISIMLVSFLNDTFSQVVEIGRANCFGQSAVQVWRTVSDNQSFYKQKLIGEISLISRNLGPQGPPWNDGDWNIYIRPNSEFEELLFNSENEINRHDDPSKNRKIELEVLNPFPLNNYFKVGDLIETFGWWVEDGGHENKTEIHPIIYLKKQEGNKIFAFSTIDASGRFEDTHPNNNLVNHSDFTITIPFQPLKSQLDLSDNYSGFFSTNNLQEKATFDKMFDSRLTNERTVMGKVKVFGNHMTVQPKFQRNLTPDSGNPCGVLQNHGEITYAATLTRPFYFGEFTNRGKHLNSIKETVSKEFRNSNGRQSILYTIKLTIDGLAASNSENKRYSLFQYEGVNAYGELEFFEEESESNHSITFQIEYSPEKGLYQNNFDILVFGFDKALNKTPNIIADLGGFNRSENADYFYAVRKYKIQPSSIDMSISNVTTVYGPCITNSFSAGKIPCTTKFKLMPKTNFAAPEVHQNGIFKWKYRMVRDYDGRNRFTNYKDLPNPLLPLPTIRDNSPSIIPSKLKDSYFEFTNYGDTLIIDFLDQNQNLFDYDNLSQNFNRSKIEVVCYSLTSIGEEVNYSTTLELPPCDCEIPELLVMPDFFYRLIPSVLIADNLGIGIQNLEKELPDIFINAFPKKISALDYSFDILKDYQFKIKENREFISTLFNSKSQSKQQRTKAIEMILTLSNKLEKLDYEISYNNPQLSQYNEKTSKRILANYEINEITDNNLMVSRIEQFLLNDNKNNMILVYEYVDKMNSNEYKQIKGIRRGLIKKGFSKKRIGLTNRKNPNKDSSSLKIKLQNE